MKAPLSWLKEWVSVRAGAGEIAKRLTFAGLEVEGLQDVEGEPVLEVNVTPNRGDCLSIKGLAREISALYGVPLKSPVKKPIPKTGSKSPIGISIARPKSCPRYALAVIEGVRVGPSPEWLVRRLTQTGVRSVNNVVDVTNFILMELGQPLHAFDAAKIRGRKIIVRNAKAGEVLKTLDGLDRKLEAEDLVIADAEGPVALAGVMGGADSEVDSSTTSVALECAFFDPTVVRRSARTLGIQSESSYRFERRVDPEGIPAALHRAVELVVQVSGGKLQAITDLYKEKQPSVRIKFRPSEVGAILGGEWKDSEIRSTLTRLGFAVKGGGKDWHVAVPSRRGDVTRTVDLVEEVARLQGLERIPEKFPALKAPLPGGTDLSGERLIKSLLTDLGLQETIHLSFVSPELVGEIAGGDGPMLANPLSREDAMLRPSLLPSLLSAAAFHSRHKMETFRAFELRKVFMQAGGGNVVERKQLAGMLMGGRLHGHWSDGVRGTDFFDVKALVEAVLSALGLEARFLKGNPPVPFLHPGQQARVLLGGKDGGDLGVLGEVHPDVLAKFGLKKSAYVFELDGELLFRAGLKAPRFREYARTPAVERDMAVILGEDVEAGAVLDWIRRTDPVIAEAKVFDLYRGGQIPQGKKSLAFSIRMSRPDRTLVDEEVNEVFQRVVERVKTEFGAEVRQQQ